MKIIKVEPIILTLPLQKAVVTSFGEMNERTGVFLKVITDTDECGIGEVWNNFPSWGAHEKIATLKYGMEPLLIGEDPRNINKINQKLYRSCMILGLQWGALGPIYQSISGIDIALWDLLGKHYNKPVYELLGGKKTNDVEVYASGLNPSGFETLVDDHKKMGVTQFKLKVGTGIEKDLANVKKIRKLLDQDDKLMIDANQAWDQSSAIEHIHQFEPFDLAWVEEPIRCDDLEGLQKIHNLTDVAIAGGENLYGRNDVRKTVDANALDVIQPDLSKNGGISEASVIAENAKQRGITFVPHFLGGAVCLAASLHLVASISGCSILEMDANSNPLREKLFTEPFVINNGKITVPEGPGLGFELDEAFVNEYKTNMKAL